jgi:hypothetical protein
MVSENQLPRPETPTSATFTLSFAAYVRADQAFSRNKPVPPTATFWRNTRRVVFRAITALLGDIYHKCPVHDVGLGYDLTAAPRSLQWLTGSGPILPVVRSRQGTPKKLWKILYFPLDSYDKCHKLTMTIVIGGIP